MIAWTASSALAGLALLAGPILVHMLLRRNARRVVFPTTRFLESTRAAAVRFRRPSDLGLLLLRLAIVLAAVLAAAQPVLLSGWRTSRWQHRIARALVIDTSRSMPNPAEARRLADQEPAPFAAALFESDDLADGLRRATEWLARTPPARREVVVISDFQRGSISDPDLAGVPAEIGLRFIRAGTHADTQSVPLPNTSGWRGAEWQATATLKGDRLDAAWARRGAGAISWLTARGAPSDAAAAARAVAGAASLGVAAGDDSHRVVVAFRGAGIQGGAEPSAPWMLRAAANLSRSGLLREVGTPVSIADLDGALIVRADVPAGSAVAPAVIRAAMVAVRPVTVADTELEVAVIPDAQLSAWRRDSALPGTIDHVTSSDAADARWLWAVALGLLAVETWVRRQSASRADREVRADAA